MYLVVGATGVLGSEICRLLAGEGKPVRALVRPTSDQKRVKELENLNVDIAVGDLKDRSSIDAACRGVSEVISTASSTFARQEGDSLQTVDLEGQLNLIDEAKAANVRRFVMVSFPHADIEFPLQDAKRAVEDHLKNSGLTYTILQPTFFMEVWLSPALGFDAANATAQIYGSGENKISWISYKDVAKFAVALSDHTEARSTVIELGGPQALSPLEVVKIFEELKGKDFDIQHVPEEALKEQRKGASDPLQKSFAGLMINYSQGVIIDMQETLQKFPVELTSIRDYAQASV